MTKIFIESEFCSVEKDFLSEITYNQLCDKLYNLTGIEPIDMNIDVKYKRGSNAVTLSKMGNDIIDTTDIDRLIVTDVNENSMVNQLKQTGNSNGTVFHLSEEEYAKKQDSVLNWKKENKLGRFDPRYQEKLKHHHSLQEEKIKNLALNQRCEVKSSTSPSNINSVRRGWLRFLGPVPEIPANSKEEEIWCGIEFDEPLGKNNGSIKGKQYFGPVGPNYGGFVKPVYVETGPEYTPIDEFASSDEEI